MQANDKIYINQLRIGDRVSDLFVASDAALIPFRPDSKKQGNFMRFTLSDKSGSLPAIMWEGGEAIFAHLGQGAIVRVQGGISQYRGELQVVVDRLAIEGEPVDFRCFFPHAPRPQAEMERELAAAIEKIQRPELRWLLTTVFDDQKFHKSFTQAPAAKMIHHAYLGGLLEHTLETVRFAEAIAEQYPTYINRELLLTGAILHDCGKTLEYGWEGPAITITDIGKLYGHLVLGAHLINNIMDQHRGFPESLKQELVHMILSHHGTQEWGSPQPPKTINAFALHHADHLSAELNHFQGVLHNMPESDIKWSALDRKLGRSLFLGFSELQEIAVAKENEN